MRRSRALVRPLSALLVLAATATLLLGPVPEGASERLIRAGGLIVFTVGFWATAAIPEVLTAIVFFLIAMLFAIAPRSEEHTSELQSLMRISYAVFCLKKKKKNRHKRCTIHNAQ